MNRRDRERYYADQAAKDALKAQAETDRAADRVVMAQELQAYEAQCAAVAQADAQAAGRRCLGLGGGRQRGEGGNGGGQGQAQAAAHRRRGACDLPATQRGVDHQLRRAAPGRRAHFDRLRRERGQPGRLQAVLKEAVDALDPGWRAPCAAGPNACAQRRTGGRLQALMAGVPAAVQGRTR